MKTCLCCGHAAADSDATCPKCGEGSWSASSADPKTVPDAPKPKGKGKGR